MKEDIMNRIFQSAWNDRTGTFVAVSETAIRAVGKSSPGARLGADSGNKLFALKALAASVMLAFCANAIALPPTGPVTPHGMTLIAGTAATGPGVAGGGTLKIAPGTIITVTGPAGISPVNITYNPVSYTAPTNYSGFFATGDGAPFTQNMLVFPGGANKVADGTTTAVFTSFQPDINGLVPGGGAMTLAGGAANYDTALAGVNKPITYSGYTLGGASAGFALPIACCGVVTRTTGTIAPLPIPPVPPGTPPVLPIAPDTPIETVEAVVAPGFVMGDEMFLATGPAWLPTAVDTRTPPQLLSIAPPVVIPPTPVVSPPPPIEEEKPPIHAPPARPPKQDRN